MIKGHGGNIAEAARISGRPIDEIVDMSSNTNPLGPMPGMVEHLQARMECITNLPEAGSDNIVQSYADMKGLEPQRVLAAGGTTQFIYSIPRIFSSGRALILGPTYSDYADACFMNKMPFTWIVSDSGKGFIHDLEAVSRISGSYDLVFLCNPNNPTGVLLDPDEICRLANKCPRTIFVVDESYLPFVSEYSKLSVAKAGLPNVLVLSSFSKIFKVPGLRIGFTIAHEVLKERLECFQLPWSVGTLGQEAVAYVGSNSEAARNYVVTTADYVKLEMEKATRIMGKVNGLAMYQGVASFVLFKLPHGISASAVWKGMLEQGVLVRDCSNFHGLGSQYVRLSLKDSQTNAHAFQALANLVREAPLEGKA